MKSNDDNAVWYKRPTVHHFSVKSIKIVFIFGSFHALDEMMFRLTGQFIETCRIKYKPINRFMIKFSPDGRITAKITEDGKMDFETNA